MQVLEVRVDADGGLTPDEAMTLVEESVLTDFLDVRWVRTEEPESPGLSSTDPETKEATHG